MAFEREHKLLELLVRSSVDGILAFDQQCRYTLWNPAMERITKRRAEEILGQNAFEVFPFLREIGEDKYFHEALAGRSVNLKDHRFRSPDEPRDRFYDALYSPIYESAQGSSSIVGGLAVIRDVTDRKKADESLRQKTKFVHLLEAVTQAANSLNSARVAMQRCLVEVCVITGWPLGHVYSKANENLLVPSEVWFVKYPSQFQAFQKATMELPLKKGDCLPGRVFERGRPLWLQDIGSHGSFLRAPVAAKVGLKSAFAFPVMVGTEVVAVLEFFDLKPSELDESFLEVMAHIGTLLGRVWEKERAEVALKASEQRYRSIVELACDGFVGMDSEGLITDWNRRAEVMFGWSQKEVLGRSALELLVPPEARTAFLQRWRWLNEKKRVPIPPLQEFSAKCKDGKTLPIEFSISMMRWGETKFIAAFAHDISERKEAEEQRVGRLMADAARQEAELAEARMSKKARELARSNSDLEQFAYAASHDLKEPLRVVSSYLHLLKMRHTDRLHPEASEFIQFALDGATRMYSLINDLLAYARVDLKAGQMTTVEMGPAAQTALDSLSDHIRETGADISVGTLPTVFAEKTQLIQLFHHLIENAIKFRRQEKPVIHISSEKKGTEWICSVRDNGIGIDAKNFQRIFMLFQRLHARETYPGSGVGLSICKKIVERHGGRLWLESSLAAGSTFFFSLPEIKSSES